MFPLSRLIEQLLGIGALVLLAIGCALVLWPFLSAIMWAAVICFSTWPIYRRCERAVGGNRAAAAAAMTMLVVIVVAAPLAFVVTALADDIKNLAEGITRVLEQGPPAPPNWVKGLPVVGENLATYWEGLAHDAPAFIVELKKLTGPVTDIALAGGAAFGTGLLEVALSIFITFFLFLHGRRMISFMRQIGERVAGTRARRLLAVIGMTVKGVVYGMIGTALAQGLLAGVGFWIAGVPQSLLLGCLTFLLSFVPAGPPFVWGPVALWLLMQGSVWWGLFIAMWGLLLVSSIDNFLRPYLLGQNINLPVLLGLFGLVGGVLAFGLIGLFLGPTLLAVAYNLFLEWVVTELEERTLRASPSAAADHLEADPRD
ncbi:AI-2E family transporter [Sinorhizobium alkalisoli]|uniref:AI-2E family transporter n=1 Tax=Sinorhizobium alkalisoli TaxID=1752398 RepID=A0A1E3VD78_9HYPH|nr:AI-2E family transporter [Sinorhizobium alkalisoli]MCG5480729.1 AI-2E family transporter [Sinorhizobium alkalisoli]ODR91532.1 AI-2E family transporter [Sinorhizobium alkalisoli]QFI67207.1 Putative membrane protein [Sinorhizobium alkalisoli]